MLIPWLASGVAQAGAAPPVYDYVPIVGPPGMELYTTGLNDSGQVAGYYCDFTARQIPCRGFIFAQGVLQTVNPPGAVYSTLLAISNDGTVGGQYQTDFTSTDTFGFTYKNGVFRYFGKAGASTRIEAISNKDELAGTSFSRESSAAFTITHGIQQTFDTAPFSVSLSGINAAGTIIGTFNRPYGAFVVRGGIATHLEIPGGKQILALAINKEGAIIGWYTDALSGVVYGYVDLKGVITQLSFPGRTNTRANGINDKGDVVGFGQSVDGSPDEGWILHSGVYTVVAPPGAVNSQADAVNNKGQILGYNLASTGLAAAYLATPRP